MKSNSIATISIVIASSWFARLAERRILQVAQDVVQPLRYPGERDLHALDVEIRLALLQARQSFAQIPASRRSARPAHTPTASAATKATREFGGAGWPVSGKPPCDAMRRNIAITSISGGGCATAGFSSAARLRCAAGLPRAARRPHAAGRHDAQVRQVPVDVCIDRGDFAERRLIQLLQDLELDAAVGLAARQAPPRTR